jgi:hypothetical protein
MQGLSETILDVVYIQENITRDSSPYFYEVQ